MIDIHPPQHGSMTTRDFFVHLGIVVLGILIAIGLEQSVEFLHHRRQRQELQQQLHADAERTLYDTARWEPVLSARLQYLRARSDQITASIHGRNLLAPEPPQTGAADSPIEPAWQAAKAGGTVALLPAEDIKVYTELDGMESVVWENYRSYAVALHNLSDFAWSIDGFDSRPESINVDTLTPDQKREYLNLILQSYRSDIDLRDWLRQLRGGTMAVAAGERDLKKINVAERQFDPQP